MRAVLACLLVLLGAPALAELPALTPLNAHYRVTVNGVPAGTAATVAVRALGGTRYEANFHVENRFFRHDEVSRFDWQDCAVTPLEYRHEFDGLGISRDTALVFDWSRMVAIETRGEKLRELPLAPGIADGLNMAMLARCRLRSGERQLHVPVIYKGERKNLDFDVTGSEPVDTDLGRFDALVVERRYPGARFKRTRVWVAPALDWFMVRFEHVENPAARGSLLLTGFEQAGRSPAGTKTGKARR